MATIACLDCGMFPGYVSGHASRYVSRYVSAMFRRYMALDERDVVSGYASRYALGYASRGQTCVSGLQGGLL